MDRVPSWFLGVLLAFAGVFSASAQTPVPLPITGNLGTIPGKPQAYSGVLIQLQNCPTPAAITGYTAIVQTAYQIQASPAGLVNATVWPNDLINCNGTTGNSRYSLFYLVNGVPSGTQQCYQVNSTQGVWNLNTQQPIACTQSPPNPQDLQIRNLSVTDCISISGSSCTPQVYVSSTQSTTQTMAGPLNSTSLSATTPGVFTPTQPNQPNTFNTNSLNIQNEVVAGQPAGTHFTEALTAGVNIPVGTQIQTNSIGSFVLNNSTTSAAVAGYFECHQNATSTLGTGCWGLNPIVVGTAGSVGKLTGIEVDLNTKNNSDTAYGVDVNGLALSFSPNTFALYVNPLGNFPWNYGLNLADNCCMTHYIGKVTTTGASSSQPLFFASQTTGGTTYQSEIVLDSTGNLQLIPPANGSNSLSIGNNATLNAIAANFSNSITFTFGGVGIKGPNANQGLTDDTAAGWNFSIATGSAFGWRFWKGAPGTTLLAQIDPSGSFINGHGTLLPSTFTGNTGNPTGQVVGGLTCTTGSIGGSALTAGQSATGTCTISAFATGHPAIATESDGSNIGGSFNVRATVSGTTVTVAVQDVVAGTPTAKTYNVTVF